MTSPRSFYARTVTWLGWLTFTAITLGVMVRGYPPTTWREVLQALSVLPLTRFLTAAALTCVAFAVLSTFDRLALAHFGHRLSARRAALASLLSYAIGQSVGVSFLSAAAIRFRLYTSWGFTKADVAGIVAFSALTFWLGLLCMLAVAFATDLVTLPSVLNLPPALLEAGGWGCATFVGGYLLLSIVRSRDGSLGQVSLCIPRPRIVLLQLLLSTLDWILAATIMSVLLPWRGEIDFPTFVAMFAVAQFAGVVSNLPGGLGVFDAVMLAELSSRLAAGSVLSALIAFRAIYYAAPLVVGVVLFMTRELLVHREQARRYWRVAVGSAPTLAPPLLALAVFVGGVVLLFSGATPAIRHREALLQEVSTTTLIASAYFASSLIGVALLFVARGLHRRLDGAYALAIPLLLGGIVSSFAKGLDFEEATYLFLVLLLLMPARRWFSRPASLLALPLTRSWVTAIVVVLAATAWLVVFGPNHVYVPGEISAHILLWGGSHAIRATTFALFSGSMGLLHLLRPARTVVAAPDQMTVSRAQVIVRSSPQACAHLSLVGDKALLFSRNGRSFLMYGIAGRSWIAMGDPVGSPEERSELVWRFRELAAAHGADTAFYLVSPENLPLYVDLGLRLLKMGETARVSLLEFSLDGGSRKWLRRARRVAMTDGCTFGVVAADDVAAELDALQRVSNAWMASRRTREKRFSLGYFDAGYLQRGPVAVIRRGSELVAFANLWPGAPGGELSVDLLRFTQSAPPGVTDYLFSELFLWGRARGYAWFDLGMAPLAGLQRGALAPLWQRAGATLFLQGTRYYNFDGLRRYKDKFDPIWEPRYLATPGGLAVPRVLTNLASLISHGIGGLVAA